MERRANGRSDQYLPRLHNADIGECFRLHTWHLSEPLPTQVDADGRYLIRMSIHESYNLFPHRIYL
jgi:hypothetical protein